MWYGFQNAGAKPSMKSSEGIWGYIRTVACLGIADRSSARFRILITKFLRKAMTMVTQRAHLICRCIGAPKEPAAPGQGISITRLRASDKIARLGGSQNQALSSHDLIEPAVHSAKVGITVRDAQRIPVYCFAKSPWGLPGRPGPAEK